MRRISFNFSRDGKYYSWSNHMKKIITVTAALFMTAGCNTIMPEQIQANNLVNLVEYEQVTNFEADLLNEHARWGGAIANVAHHGSKSVIEVVNFELAEDGKPIIARQTQGHFKIVVDGYVDPRIYGKGRLITAVGSIATDYYDPEKRQSAQYPVLDTSSLYLWKKGRKVNIAYFQPNADGQITADSPYIKQVSPFRGIQYNYNHDGIAVRNDSGPSFNKNHKDNGRQPTYSSRKKAG